ncbi:type VI secretion system-associated FHA domain protein TagH [Sphingomonas sp.]|jgi:type VI secretion system FHA domain protein|uniref:type VI secretion system-associated FHA domain protein TagH n=1 Tax=Sphingomonas sp. TaxID=28214 RepID=UPI002D80742B|nr:type VI secretion system-associated FHA domain protein TagH [Sphingomonas sp.]HEU0044665.1 type VI secretion system-associated FHA domain protein TagH [Sphingomonas sp.]
MTLTLTIRNVDRLDNGMPCEFVLNRRGAMIGRAATCDWSLPDPRNYISSRHGEIVYRDGFYLFNDISTNGTFLNGDGERMTDPHRIEHGDLFLVGHYEVVASLSGEAAAAVERHDAQQASAAHEQGGWGWDAHGGASTPPPEPERGGWGDAPANSGLASGMGGAAAPLDGGWSAPTGGGGGWDDAPAPSSGGDWGGARSSNDGWGAALAPTAPDAAAWAPQAGPSLSAPTPYAARGGAGGAAPPSGPMDSGNSWTPAPVQAEARAASPWDSAQAPVQQSSAWSSAVPDRPKAATPNDIWGSMENSNVVDWARADFGQKQAENADPLGLNKLAADALPRQLPTGPQPQAPPAGDGGWSSAPQGAPMAPGGWGAVAAPSAAAAATPAVEPTNRAASLPSAPPPRVAAPPAPDAAALAMALAMAAGLKPEQVTQPGPETLTRAGELLRRLISGLVVMVEARARAKSQMGAEQTGLEFDGNNPIKFARSPDQALAALLNPPERGFMPAEKAIEDAYFDLQSHQMATLKAMQGALRATLDRFSPDAIRKRAETGGFLQRLLPGGREATLWTTYEREFSGVAQGSDEAFMDVFAKEFRQAYDEQSRKRRR